MKRKNLIKWIVVSPLCLILLMSYGLVSKDNVNSIRELKLEHSPVKADLNNLKNSIRNAVMIRHLKSSDFRIVSTKVLVDNKKVGKWTRIDYITNDNISNNLVLIENGMLVIPKSQKMDNKTSLKFNTSASGDRILLKEGDTVIYCTGTCGCSISGTFPPPQGTCSCQDCTLTIDEKTTLPD